MDLNDFLESTREDRPPAGLPPVLLALWYAEQGAWDRAHQCAQEIHSPEGSWVHAHLHREEGDLGNARYWYARADQPEATVSVEQERRALIEHFLHLA